MDKTSAATRVSIVLSAEGTTKPKNHRTIRRLAGVARKLDERQIGARGSIGADLPYARFNQADLSAANFSGARLDYADFAGANLKQANLRDASLRFAILSAADLATADMFRADLQHAQLNQAHFSAANLSNALLDHADFSGAKLANVKLCGASLRFTIMSAADLGAADLSGADLQHARFNQADLSAANLSGALLDYADFAGANLAKVNLSGASLRYAKNLTQTQIEQGRVTDSTVLPSRLRESVPWSEAPQAGTSDHRPAWVVGIFLTGALVAIGFSWQQLNHAAPEPREQVPVSPEEAHGKFVSEAPPPVAAASPVSASRNATLVAPELLIEVAGVSPILSAALPAITSLGATIPAPDVPADASEALPLIVALAPASTLSHGAVPDPQITVSIPDPAAELEAELPTLGTPRFSALSLRDVPPAAIGAIPPTLVIPVTEVPTEGKDEHESGAKLVDNAIAGATNGEPMLLVVSLSHQKLDVYRGTTLVTTSKVSSGKRGYVTKAGVFSILGKQRRHHSNLYSGAPMPWMQRLTRTGTALHGGVVPGYPASHGCVRLPFSFAPKLFEMTSVGENVVVAPDRVAPSLIEHQNLFQPLPLSAQPPVTLAEKESPASDVRFAAELAASESPATNDQANGYARSTAPLRILVTRRTERDRIIDVQYVLSSMGYLMPQNFSGRIGTETIAAIKAFEKANGMRETGTFTDELAKKVYEVAGKEEPPEGHLFVRQDFRRVFDLPVAFRNSEHTLGTHLFTAIRFSPGDARVQWVAISLEGEDSASALDRIAIPADARQRISERLTPGSSLIIADTSVDSAILPEGDDFLVWAKVTSARAEKAEARLADTEQAKTKKAKVKHAKVAPAKSKPRIEGKRKRATRRDYDRPVTVGRSGLFWSW